MGAACTICKSGGESYDLSRGHKVKQEPHRDEQRSQRQSSVETGAQRPAKTNSADRDVEDSSSSKDVNLEVVEESNHQIQKESKTEGVKVVQERSDVEHDSEMNFQTTLSSSKVVKAGHLKTSQSDLSNLERMTEDEAHDIVKKCWQNIEKTCDVKTQITKPAAGWRVIRLFVSSTFTDYHAERELLVKKVFPELREWCEERRLQLIECDLRWGVPKDTTTEMTIKTCLSEIDRCKEESNDAAFFLNMLGERYGWMPSESDIPQDIQDDYQWIFPVSITHMEILHAAYRTKNPNAAFFLRDPGFIADIPIEMKPAFVDEFPLNKASLKMLKQKLKERFPDQVFEYGCEYDGTDESTGKEKVKLKGLGSFGEAVLNHFKSCIEKTFPPSQKELSPEEQEIVSQDDFIRSRGSLLLGRKNEVDNILEFATKGTLPGQTVHGNASPMLLVQGVPGSGKSSLMAYCTLRIKNETGILLFYHFVGSGPGSTDALKLSNRLYRWLKSITDKNEDQRNEDDEIPLHGMQEKMQLALKEVEKMDKIVVIVIDAVNQLSDLESVEHLKWIPVEIPQNVHFIASAVKESRSSFVLLNEEKRPEPFDLFVGELDDIVKKEIVNHILGIYNKKLDEQQMALLISVEGASNPLWLSLSCEELRVFGVFERVTMHIQSLPSFLEGLLQFILKRLITEDEFNNVEKVLCALFCMSLTETELRYLLKEDESSDDPLPMLKWGVVRRTLRPFLRNTGQQGEEERLDFFHASISNLVKDSLMPDQSEKRKWHSKVADYFQYVCKDERRATDSVATQLKNADDRKRLLGFLRNDIRAQRKTPVWKSQFYKVIMCGRMIPQIANFREEVSLCQMCSMQHKGFGQVAGLNKDSCVVCGNFVPAFWRKPEHVAMLCERHKPRHAPGQKMCYICNKPTFFNAQTAYTCMICSPGFQRCVKMVT